jgi:hypothetical protein
MTESERVVARLQAKFAKGGALSGAEDYQLCAARERVVQEQIDKRSRSKSVITQQTVDDIARRAFKKAMHLSDADEQHLRNLRDTVKAAAEHVDKISFEDRDPSGGELESRGPADAVMPAKSAGVDINLLKGRDLAQLIGNACCKAARTKAVNMNPAASDVPGIPGRPLGTGDAGGELGDPSRAELDSAARAGNAAAQATLMQRAMRPFMMSRRY